MLFITHEAGKRRQAPFLAEVFHVRIFFFFSLLASLTLANAHPAIAANTPPGFETARWEKLWKLAAFIGEKMNFGENQQLRHFKNIVPENQALPHKADYFSTIGVLDQFGKYHAQEISVVSEDWRRQGNGNWEIEQWIFQVRLNGDLKSVRHALVIKTPDGLVLDIQELPSGAADSPEELARWGTKLHEWYELYP